MKVDVGTDRVMHRKRDLLWAFILILGGFLLGYLRVLDAVYRRSLNRGLFGHFLRNGHASPEKTKRATVIMSRWVIGVFGIILLVAIHGMLPNQSSSRYLIYPILGFWVTGLSPIIFRSLRI